MEEQPYVDRATMLGLVLVISVVVAICGFTGFLILVMLDWLTLTGAATATGIAFIGTALACLTYWRWKGIC